MFYPRPRPIKTAFGPCLALPRFLFCLRCFPIYMAAENHTQLASFIWSICNLLRGPYKRNEYRKVILPLTVLRRFDCILAPTKAEVLEKYEKVKERPDKVVQSQLCSVAG